MKIFERSQSHLQRLLDVLRSRSVRGDPVRSPSLSRRPLSSVLALLCCQGRLNSFCSTHRLDQSPGHSVAQQHDYGAIAG